MGIVCIDEPALKKMCASNGIEDMALGNLITDYKVNELVLKLLNESATSAKLKGFERLKKILLVAKNFQDLGLTTPTFKLKRKETSDHYKAELNQLYHGLQ